MTLSTQAEHRIGEDIEQILDEARTSGLAIAENVIADAVVDAEATGEVPDQYDLIVKAEQRANEVIKSTPVPSHLRGLRSTVAEEEAEVARIEVESLYDDAMNDADIPDSE